VITITGFDDHLRLDLISPHFWTGLIEAGEDVPEVARGEPAQEASLEQLRGALFGLAGEGKDIKVQVVPLSTALDWLSQGRLQAATMVIALQWLALHRAELSARWAGWGPRLLSSRPRAANRTAIRKVGPSMGDVDRMAESVSRASAFLKSPANPNQPLIALDPPGALEVDLR
jgi:hypothetical protein